VVPDRVLEVVPDPPDPPVDPETDELDSEDELPLLVVIVGELTSPHSLLSLI